MPGGEKTTQTTSQEPYAAAKPLLNQAMGDALSAYKSGGLVKPNSMSTVVPYSQASLVGMDSVQRNSHQNVLANPLQDALWNFDTSFGAQGYNQQQNAALQALSPYTGGAGNVGTSQIDQLGALARGNPAQAGYDRMVGGSAAEQNLMNVARGDMLNRADPNFERVLQSATDNAAQQVNSMAGGMGRYSSGAHQGVLAREIGDLQAGARMDQYNTERDRQMQAINAIDQTRLAALGGQAGVYQGGIGQALQAAGTSAGIQGQNADRRLGAIAQQFNAGQTGMNNLGNAGDVYASLLAGQNAPGANMMGIGSMWEDLSARTLNDQLRIANEQSNAPLANIQALLAAASGAGQYGTGTAVAQGPSNTLSNVLGGVLGGASLLGGLF